MDLNTKQEILEVLTMPEETFWSQVAPAAREVCQKQFGTSLLVTAMLAYTNICKNQCLYCGMRAGNKIPRYRMSPEEILPLAQRAREDGLGRMFLLAGEDQNYGFEKLLTLIAGLRQQGYAAGGFAGVTDSVVPTGSGLSSSAAFELLLGQIQNALYNDGAIPPVALARIGQYAENEYFGKPCGLMDQTASAVGSAVAIDFLCPKAPIVERLPCDFACWGMTMYVVNTGGSHADLTEDYTAIPREMRAVAAQFGCRVLREVDPAEFYAGLPGLRGKVSDRAILRAMHFFEENERVPRLAAALREPTAEHYLEEMLASGESSMEKLQNIYPADPNERGLALALSLCRRELTGCGGWRVHGGGFAGTVQALVPREREAGFLRVMRETFGEESCTHLTVRAVGACELEFPE